MNSAIPGMSSGFPGGHTMRITLPGAKVPGSWHSNIIDAVSGPAIGNPREGRGVKRAKSGRDTQAELYKGTMEEGSAGILALAQAPSAN